jgi:hypothetical protein
MAQADVPDPQYCEVAPWDAWGQAFVTPGQQSNADEITITVHNNADLPIDGADVELDFSGCANRCEGTAGLTGQTGGTGTLVLNPAMGGCEDCTVIVRANGVTIATYTRMVSTDWNGAACGGNTGPTSLAFFAAAFNTGSGSCASYLVYDGNPGPGDLGKVANSFNSGDAN